MLLAGNANQDGKVKGEKKEGTPPSALCRQWLAFSISTRQRQSKGRGVRGNFSEGVDPTRGGKKKKKKRGKKRNAGPHVVPPPHYV